MIINFSNIGSGGGGGYVLPTATAGRLGGVKIGSGITVENDGTISVSGGSSNVKTYVLNLMTQEERAALYTEIAPYWTNNYSISSGFPIENYQFFYWAGNRDLSYFYYGGFIELELASFNSNNLYFTNLVAEGGQPGQNKHKSIWIDFELDSNGNLTNRSYESEPYKLPTASDSTLGGIKVGSGLTIDSGGTLSVSGGTGGNSNFVITEALSSITNPVEGMMAFVPFHAVDESVEFVKIQIKPEENPEDVLCRIRRVSDDADINTVYQSGSQFHWGPWNEDGANDDFKFRKVKVGDYDVVFRSYNDSDTPNNSWIEITPNSAIYFDVTNVATTSLTSETLTTTFVDTFYQYNGTKWMQLDLAKSYNFDKMTAADRLALYNEIAGELSSGVTDWGEYAFYINGRDNSMSKTPIRVYFDRDYYGSLIFGNTLPDVQDNSQIENFRVVLNSDGSFNVETNILKTVKEAKLLGSGGSEIHYKEDTGEFILDGWNNITYTGTTNCSGELGEMYSDSIISQISSGPLNYSTNKLVIRDGDDYKEVYNCPQPSYSKFSPAVNCTDPDSNSIPFDIDFEYNYGKYSIKFWGSTSDSNQGKRKIANIRLVDNTI